MGDLGRQFEQEFLGQIKHDKSVLRAGLQAQSLSVGEAFPD